MTDLVSRIFTTKTKSGKKVNVGGAVFDTSRVGVYRTTPFLAKWGGILGATGAVMLTLNDAVRYTVDKAIHYSTLGNYDLSNVIGPNPQSTRANLVNLGITGLVGVGMWVTYQYGILRLKRNSEKAAEDGGDLAAEAYQAGEAARQARQAVSDAGETARAQQKIATLNRAAQESTR
jgi:hypothetical protein